MTQQAKIIAAAVITLFCTGLLLAVYYLGAAHERQSNNAAVNKKIIELTAEYDKKLADIMKTQKDDSEAVTEIEIVEIKTTEYVEVIKYEVERIEVPGDCTVFATDIVQLLHETSLGYR